MSTTNLQSIVPVLPSADIERDVVWYENQIGFKAIYVDKMYAVLQRDNLTIHLQWHANTTEDPLLGGSVVRLMVSAIKPVFEEFVNRKTVDSQQLKLHTPWNTHEFGLYDLNKNSIIWVENLDKLTKPDIQVGLGGVFFKAQNPQQLMNWYAEHLGFKVDEYGTSFLLYSENRTPEHLVWSVFKQQTNYFQPSDKDFMINYRVKGLEALLEQLKAKGVSIVGELQQYEYGTFAHILDIENNKIELWEAVEEAFAAITENVN